MTTITATAPPSPEATLPHPEFKKGDRLKIVIANIEQNVRGEAVETANKRLNEKLGEGGRFNKFLKGIWHGNAAREFYLNKYTKEAEAQIRESGNLYHHKGVDADTAYEVSTTQRLTAEFDDLLHKGENGKGDSRLLISDSMEDGSPNPEGAALKHEIFDLIEKFADGTVPTVEAFEEEKKRVVDELIKQGLSPDYLHEAMLYTDNLLQIAQNVKAMVAHEKGVVGSVLSDKEIVSSILENADVFVAEANVGAHTEVEHTTFERISKKLESVPFVPDSAIAAAYSLTAAVTKSAIGSATQFGAFGVGAGALAALREKRALKEERAFVGRRLATEESTTDSLTGRAKELQEASIEGKTSETLKDQINVLYDPSGKLKITDQNSFEEALQIISESQSRMRLSVDMGLDFIWGTNKSKQELEELALKARCDLFEFMEGATDDELKALGIQDGDIPKLRGNRKEALDFVLEPKIECYKDVLVQGDGEVKGVEQANRAYSKLQAKKMGVAFIKGATLSAAAALIGQEGFAFASDNQQGIVENAVGIDHGTDATSETLLEGLIDNPRPEAFAPTENSPSFNLPNEDIIKMPEGFSVTTEQDGTLTVDGPDNVKVEGLALNSEGDLSADAANQLEDAGFEVDASVEQVDDSQAQEVIAAPNEYLANHAEDTMRVTRDFHMDNGSPLRPNGTELNLHYDGINENGNYVVRLSGLDEVATTSANGEQILLGEALANDKMDLQISLDKATQTNVVSIDFNAQGIAEIPPEHSSLFNMDGGVMESNAQYVEASYVGEVDANGVTHVQPIATDIGEARGAFNDIVVTENVKDVTTYKVSYEPPAIDREVDAPPVAVPLYSRGGLETSPNTAPSPAATPPAAAPTPGPGTTGTTTTTAPAAPPGAPGTPQPGGPDTLGTPGPGTTPGTAPPPGADLPSVGPPTSEGAPPFTAPTSPGAPDVASGAPGTFAPGTETADAAGAGTRTSAAGSPGAALPIGGSSSGSEAGGGGPSEPGANPTAAPGTPGGDSGDTATSDDGTSGTASNTTAPSTPGSDASGGQAAGADSGDATGATTPSDEAPQAPPAANTSNGGGSTAADLERLRAGFAGFGAPAEPQAPRPNTPLRPPRQRDNRVSIPFTYNPADRRPFTGMTDNPQFREADLVKKVLYLKVANNDRLRDWASPEAQSVAQQAINLAKERIRGSSVAVLRGALAYLDREAKANTNPLYEDARNIVNQYMGEYRSLSAEREGAGQR